jgi:NAD(P)-dependent dehydrogenase (short-subunit alcohol dehydrogenase family)
MRLEGRCALVTGAGTGGRDGHRPSVRGRGRGRRGPFLRRRPSRDRPWPARSGRRTRQALAPHADFADSSAARDLVRRGRAALGGLDIVAHGAAVISRVPFLGLNDAEWERVHGVTRRGTFTVGQETTRRMVCRRAGRAVRIRSVDQAPVHRGIAHYAAPRAASSSWPVPWPSSWQRRGSL